MTLLNQIQNLFEVFISYIYSLYFLFLIFIIITIYHVLLHLFRDRSYIKILKKFQDHDVDSINQLKEIPPLSIIIPAWKEGENFKQCLDSIDQLDFPKVKVIVNVGGSQEAINIANSFIQNKKFTVIYQKEGEGKLKAINDCLKFVSNGIICLLDADLLIDDKILLEMIYPLINGKEEIVMAPLFPHTSILNKDFTKYAYINREKKFRQKFTRYTFGVASNACMKHDVIKKIGRFSEKRMADDGISTGTDLSLKGIKTYLLINKMIQSLTYPIKINEYFQQNIRWIENFLLSTIKNRKLKIIKFFGLVILSIYFLIFPFLIFLNIRFVLIGLWIFYSFYLKKIRKILFYKLTDNSNLIKFKPVFYIKLIFFIYIDKIINIIAFFETLFYRKAYKRRKNLLP